MLHATANIVAEGRAVEGFVFGGMSAGRAVRSLANRAVGRVTFEAPVLERSPEFRALEAVGRRGRPLTALVNAHVLDPDWIYQPGLVGRLRSVGDVRLYGSDPVLWSAAAPWEHAKTYTAETANGLEAIVSNTTLQWRAHIATDISIRLRGEPARAVRELTDAAMEGSVVRMRAAADDARLAGIVVNDPVSGRWHLADSVDRLIDGADSDLEIVLKGLDHTPVTRRIAAAHQRGVRTSVTVRDLAPEDADILERAGVPTRVMSGLRRQHVNVVRSDGEVYVGSAFPWPPMWRGGGETGATRDIGVLLDTRDAAEATQAMRRVAHIGRARSIDEARRAGMLVHSS